MSFGRVFARVPMQDGRGSAYRLVCPRCGCASTLNAHKYHGGLPPEIVAKKFRERGWEVGNQESQDRCPNCCRAPRHPRDEEIDTTPQPQQTSPPPTVPDPPNPSLYAMFNAAKTLGSLWLAATDLEREQFMAETGLMRVPQNGAGPEPAAWTEPVPKLELDPEIEEVAELIFGKRRRM